MDYKQQASLVEVSVEEIGLGLAQVMTLDREAYWGATAPYGLDDQVAGYGLGHDADVAPAGSGLAGVGGECSRCWRPARHAGDDRPSRGVAPVATGVSS